jgi:hypothetical protein
MEQVGFQFDDDLDPTVGATHWQELKRCSVGKSAAGFPKFHTEMLPYDLMKMIGYDPRTMPKKDEDKKLDEGPRHVSTQLISLSGEIQRSIIAGKVEVMTEYLYHAISQGQYADWAEIDVVTAAIPDTSKWRETGSISFPLGAQYIITDGQHRFCALLEFVRRYPDYATRFTQAVVISVLPLERLDQWAKQSFYDKNYLHSPVTVTKALVVDTRDPHNQLARELHNHPVIKEAGGVNDVKDSLPSTAKEFATHAALYRFTRGFCEGRPGLNKPAIKKPRLTEETYEELKTQLFDWITELGTIFPHWTASTRADYLFRSSAALQALGVMGHLLCTEVEGPADRKTMIAKIGERKLDWRRTNIGEWQDAKLGVIETEEEDGKIKKQWITPRASRQAIDGTIEFLRQRSGLKEYLELKKNYATQGR